MNKLWLSQCQNLRLWIPSGCAWVSSTSCCSLESARDCSRKTGLSGTPKWPIDGVKYSGQTYGNSNRNWKSSTQKLLVTRGVWWLILHRPKSLKIEMFPPPVSQTSPFQQELCAPNQHQTQTPAAAQKAPRWINVKGKGCWRKFHE